MTYYQKRAKEIIREKHLKALIAMVLGCPCDDVQFYVENEPREVEKQIIEYLSAPRN